MTAAERIAKKVRPELESAIAAESIEETHAAVGRALAVLTKMVPPNRKRLRAERAPEVKGATPEQRRAEHRASTGDLRRVVWCRAGGSVRLDADDVWHYEGDARCEISGVELGAAWEMHHVEGGGSRRSQQRPGNVLAVSWEVHRLIHRGDLDTLRKVAAAPTLDAEARRAAQRRVDKLLEARGVPVALVVGEGR
jgi:hypothetical protein